MARPKGSTSKADSELKLVVAAFVEANAPKFQTWLDDIHKDEGALEAFKRVEALLEFCIPKLARHEETGADGGPVKHVYTWELPK